MPGKNDRGEHIFSVIVKRTYRIIEGNALKRSDSDNELRIIDEYYDNGDPEWATVQHEHELAAYKPAVDVVVIGKAYAPEGIPCTQTTVTVRIGERTKSIVVFGDRECRYRRSLDPVFSEPTPFTEMEIRYERAYGGHDEISIPEIPFLYPRNFLGKGIALRNIEDVVDGLALPNLEDPYDLLTPERIVLQEPEKWPFQPLPQGLGWFSRTWYPRTAYAGICPPFVEADTVTPEEKLGLLPPHHIALAKQFRLPSFDARFNNGASIGMTLPEIAKDESFALSGMTPEGSLHFSLPGETPEIVLDIGLGEQHLQAKMDTVSIRPDDLEVDLLWRGSCVYEGYAWLPNMKRLHAEVH